MRLLLVRHGVTLENKSGCFLGHLDVDLSKDDQPLLYLREALKAWFIDRVYSSPLIRAQETANIITDLPITVSKELIEMSFGEWDGKTSSDVEKFDSDRLTIWRKRDVPSDFRPTGGESLSELGDRVEKFLNVLYEKHATETILIVSHVYVIKAILDRVMNLPDGYHANRLWLENSSVTIVDWHSDDQKRIVHRINWTCESDYNTAKWRRAK
jgi:broad specificity phosphatase PhoE